MIAYELLARCINLTLAGQDEDGELEWIGTSKQIKDTSETEKSIIATYEFNRLWR